MAKYKEIRFFYSIELNRVKSTTVFSRIYLWQKMFSKQFITIPHSKELCFRVHSHTFNSFIFTLLCDNEKRSLIFSDAAAEITELWEAELLESLILVNVVPGIRFVVRSLGHF